jgi:hypothetical protein
MVKMDKETLNYVHKILKAEWVQGQKDADKLQAAGETLAIVAWNSGRAAGILRAMIVIEELGRLLA